MQRALIGMLLMALNCPSEAADVEMRLRVANGLTIREKHINDPNMTPMACIFTSQVAASKWVAENLGPNWTIIRIECGPVRQGS